MRNFWIIQGKIISQNVKQELFLFSFFNEQYFICSESNFSTKSHYQNTFKKRNFPDVLITQKLKLSMLRIILYFSTFGWTSSKPSPFNTVHISPSPLLPHPFSLKPHPLYNKHYPSTQTPSSFIAHPSLLTPYPHSSFLALILNPSYLIPPQSSLIIHPLTLSRILNPHLSSLIPFAILPNISFLILYN